MAAPTSIVRQPAQCSPSAAAATSSAAAAPTVAGDDHAVHIGGLCPGSIRGIEKHPSARPMRFATALSMSLR